MPLPIFKTTPYQHQLNLWQRTKDKEFFALFWEMGTGKSKLIIDTVSHLFTEQKITGFVLVSDKGCYQDFIENELPIHLWEGIGHHSFVWSSILSLKKHKTKKERLFNYDEGLSVLGINIDGLLTVRGFNLVRDFLQAHPSLLCIDESTSIKSMSAKRTKKAIELGQYAAYRRIATGTPITQSPLDMFSQCQFLKPGVLGFDNFFIFRHYFAKMITLQRGNRSFQKVVGFRNLDHLKKIIAPFSHRITKKECLDLPEKIYLTRMVELTKEQKAAYDSLKHEAFLEFEGGSLSVTHALTILTKLHQVLCGHVKDEQGKVHDIPNNRVGLLQDTVTTLLDEGCAKVIIWCNFIRDIELVMGALLGREDGLYPVSYYGDTSHQGRLKSLDKFKHDDKCRFLVGNPACGGKGLNLVEANTVIYYSNSYRLEMRLQSEDRAHRIGQENNVTYIDLVVPKSLDARILKALRAKKSIADGLLDDYKQILARKE